MFQFNDLSGHRFGRLVAMDYLGKRRWRCKCDCGKAALVQSNNLRSGKQVSCGCLRTELLRSRVLKHGHTSKRETTPEYRAWQSMLKRCYSPNNTHYARYGGRGIEVAPEWRDDFPNFLRHVGPRPSAQHSLDRIDNDGDYKPGNVRWASKSLQAKNQSRNRMYEFRGHSYCLADLREISGLKLVTLQTRLRLGWDVERAVTQPVRAP